MFIELVAVLLTDGIYKYVSIWLLVGAELPKAFDVISHSRLNFLNHLSMYVLNEEESSFLSCSIVYNNQIPKY